MKNSDWTQISTCPRETYTSDAEDGIMVRTTDSKVTGSNQAWPQITKKKKNPNQDQNQQKVKLKEEKTQIK